MFQGLMYVSLSFSSVLENVLGYVFDKVLSPVLRDVANVLINLASSLIQEILASFLLRLWITLLKLVDFLESIFDVFSGVSPVMVNDGKVSKSLTLLDYFFNLSAVQRAFLIITGIAVFVAFITTMIALLKSMADSPFENKSPISAVIRQGAKAAVTFMVVPLACLFLLQLTTQVTRVLNTYMMVDSAGSRMSDVLFISVAGSAAYSQSAQDTYASGQKYEDEDGVKKNFDINKFSYVMAYASTALVVFLMLASILQFIQRMILILLLYLTSPFFVAYMPLDGGGKFREWKNLFVAHMVSAFGPIIAMKLYFMIVPYMVGNYINYGNFDSFTFSCIKLFIVIGGAYAVYKSRLLLLSVLSPQAAGAAAESGFLGGLLAGKAIGGFSRGAAAIGGRMRGGPGGGSGAGGGQYQTKSQAYTGK